MKYQVEVGERKLSVDVRRRGREAGSWIVSVDGGPEKEVHGGQVSPAEWLLWEGEQKHRLGLHLDGEKVYAQVDG